MLSELYANGNGVQKDDSRASELAKRSFQLIIQRCGRGHTHSCAVVSLLKLENEGDLKQSLAPYWQECEKGDNEYCLIFGEAIRLIEPDEALGAFKIACDRSNGSACERAKTLSKSR